MKISKIQMQNFKYFNDLTINIPLDKEVILLIGPNGCGKSCVFDAFVNYIRPAKIGNYDSDYEYLRKDKTKEHNIFIYDEHGKLIERNFNPEMPMTKFYGRTAYRFTKDIARKSITQEASNAVKTDHGSPERFNDLDQRIEDDIEAALGEYLTKVQIKGQSTDNVINSVIEPINKSLKNIFGQNGIQIKSILNPFDGRKNDKLDVLFVKNKDEFLYKNLSAGEKEVFDIVFNFYRRVDFHIKDGIYFIDEPELHIHAGTQAKLLKELSNLCRMNNAQLWIATHSIGFIKAAYESKNKTIGIYKFSSNVSSGRKILNHSELDWKGWQKLFKTPLDDLATLTLPKKIIYCEGDQKKTGFDEKIYNTIFGKTHPESIFISSGGKTEPLNNSLLAAIVFQKLSSNVELIILSDRDKAYKNETARDNWLIENPNSKMLKRLEIENYLLDFSVLKQLYRNITEFEFKKIVNDIAMGDVKAHKQKLKNLCGDKSSGCDIFMLKLAKVLPKTTIYEELENVIFK